MSHRPRQTKAAADAVAAQMRALALEGKTPKEIAYVVDRTAVHVSKTLRNQLDLVRIFLTPEELSIIIQRRKEAGIQCVIRTV